MPANTVYVGRPTKWGNPFPPGIRHPWNGRLIVNAADSVKVYRDWLFQWARGQQIAAEARLHLRGKNLACWCKPGEPCHADVLLEIANQL